VSCLEVRDLLTEHALGLLPEEVARRVERHLEWCPGCRRELDELREGAAAVALGLPLVSPPPGLEQRVVERVLAAAGNRPAHRAPRLLLAATLAAVALAFGALGWAVAERQEAEDVRRQAEQVERQLANLRGLVELSRGLGATPFEVTLASPDRTGGSFGAAVIYSSPRTDDFVLVSAFLADQEEGAPYTVRILDPSGRILSGGPLVKTTNGDWLFRAQPRRDLARATLVVVRDRVGRVVLQGRVVPATPTPTS
jgi:hypothetical protein